jgi:hypothetical protein
VRNAMPAIFRAPCVGTIGGAVWGGSCLRNETLRRGLPEVVPLVLTINGRSLPLLWGIAGANVARLNIIFQDGSHRNRSASGRAAPSVSCLWAREGRNTVAREAGLPWAESSTKLGGRGRARDPLRAERRCRARVSGRR